VALQLGHSKLYFSFSLTISVARIRVKPELRFLQTRLSFSSSVWNIFLGSVMYEVLILRSVLTVVTKFKFVEFQFDPNSNKAVISKGQVRWYVGFIFLILRLLKMALFISVTIKSGGIMTKVVVGFLLFIVIGETSFRITLMKHGEELVDLINNLFRVNESLGK